jgi:hypothetical protein
MPANPAPSAATLQEIQARLREIGELLRQSGSLHPEAQAVFAELVDELKRDLATENLPAAEVTHLAERTAHLGEALHHQHDVGVIGKARAGLERAVGNAEAHAPLAVGLARKLLDVLANIGI